MNYVNLNVKSHYSLLNSTLRIDDIINHALKNDYHYVALADYLYFCGALEFVIKAQKNKLRPIVGLEFTLAFADYQFNVVAYAKNTAGFKNLEKLSSLIFSADNNLLKVEQFKQYQNNLMITIDLINNPLYQQYLLNDTLDQTIIEFYQTLFVEGFYYFFNNYNDESYLNKVRTQFDKPRELIASNINYELAEDASLHYLLNCLNNGEQAQSLMLKTLGKNHLLTIREIENNYSEVLIKNTKNFLARFEDIKLECQATLPLYKENEQAINEYIKQLSLKGLQKRLNNEQPDQKYLQRLKYELDTVITMGYANYFLIVYDYVLFARKNNILVGPGRGSSAGSLIAYCLGITNVDPIENNLIFERFLNPERISLPDIDVDFPDDKRDLVIDYLKKKYHHDNIAHIITFGTFQAKNSIRDLGRVLAIPNYRLDLILRQIPNVLNVRLADLLATSKQLQVVLQSNEDLNYLYQQAIKLEGINRHVSTHAAGIIITNKKIVNYCPTLPGLNDTLMIQYNMDYLESIGLYKMDILGLKNLTILSDILNDITEKIDLNKLDFNDEKTFALMSSGNTLGIFQFESAGVIKVLKKMKVDSINDMVATTALFRPGPIQYIDEYIKRKNSYQSIEYLHPDLQPILKETYGIIVYQEQIMQICQIMAGFTLAKADIVRKGMAKKDEQLLQEIKTDFIESSVKKGYAKEVAIKVYNMILLFSNYGFNKAHAYSYALLGYYLAYLKANYPKSFFKNILSANIYSPQKIKSYLYEMKQENLTIVSPNINTSALTFVIEENNFVLPFTSIKGFGENNARLLVEERQQNGPYSDYIETIIRLNKLKIKKTLIENLIYCGAFDIFGYNRKTMIENLDKISQYLEISKVHDDQQILELDFVPKPKIIKYSEDEAANNKEFELLGLYLNNHPLNKYLDDYQNALLENISAGGKALVIVDTIKEIRTKKGELMAFIGVSDVIESRTLVVFPRVYERYKSQLKVKDIVLINGEIDYKDSSNIILKQLEKLETDE